MGSFTSALKKIYPEPQLLPKLVKAKTKPNIFQHRRTNTALKKRWTSSLLRCSADDSAEQLPAGLFSIRHKKGVTKVTKAVAKMAQK